MQTSASARLVASLCMWCAVFCGISVADKGDSAREPSNAGAPETQSPMPPAALRGVYFNPQFQANEGASWEALPLSAPLGGDVWLRSYPDYRGQVCTALHELASVAGINLVDIFVSIPFSLKTLAQPPTAGQALDEWADVSYLNNIAAFVDDCHEANIAVELDLATNMWAPYSVDTERQLANSGKWPMPDETPWDESATWYCAMITYIESHAKHPEAIAMWCMMGNYQLGASEPVLWDDDGNPAINKSAEEFVKRVWPLFKAAGKRPKAAPIMLPIFSNSSYWMPKPPEARLSAFRNLKKWIADDLAMPPDYWVMTTYPYCDPAPDGFYYFREIVEILGKENALRLISTDLKGPGHDTELQDSIIPEGHTGAEMLAWHLQKCAEYGFAGWWIWEYQDRPKAVKGIRTLNGEWKTDLIKVIKPESSSK